MSWKRMAASVTLALAAMISGSHAGEVTGIRAEYLKSIADVEQKVVSLAEATPQKRFTWRPMKGVRSVSEVFMHVAGSNYILPTFAGVKPSARITPELEKSVTDKAKVIETLKASFAHLRDAITNTPDADLDNRVQTPQGEMSVRELYLATVIHGHEHLGQMIAYARVNHITPPWTAAEEAKARAMKDEKKSGDKKEGEAKEGAAK